MAEQSPCVHVQRDLIDQPLLREFYSPWAAGIALSLIARCWRDGFVSGSDIESACVQIGKFGEDEEKIRKCFVRHQTKSGIAVLHPSLATASGM